MPFSYHSKMYIFVSCLSLLGEAKTTVAPFVPGGVSDGQWHSVQLHYYNKVSLLIVGTELLLKILAYPGEKTGQVIVVVCSHDGFLTFHLHLT